MMKKIKSFQQIWKTYKSKITFEYSTLPYDPDIKTLEKVLEKKKEIEEIILERSEGMWRTLFDGDFGMTRFPFEGVEISARAWEKTTVARVDLVSKKYQTMCQKIEDTFFVPKFLANGTWKQTFYYKEVVKHLKENKPYAFTILDPHFKSEGIVDAWGTGLDQGIKDLVIVLNKLGFRTTASCEGHADHGTSHPWIHITMLDFPKFLQMLLTLSKKDFDEYIFESFRDEFRFQPPSSYSLIQGQEAFQKLTDLIKNLACNEKSSP